MIIKGWLLMMGAMVVAVVCMLFIKDKENESVKNKYLKRIGLLVCFALVASLFLYMLPTVYIVNNDKITEKGKVMGSARIDTEWGMVIPVEGLERSAEYVVNKSLDTIVLFPIIYSKAGYKAYDTYALTSDVVDIPPGQFLKASHHIDTFFVVPEEDLLKVTESRNVKGYALLTRPQLNILVNRIVVQSLEE